MVTQFFDTPDVRPRSVQKLIIVGRTLDVHKKAEDYQQALNNGYLSMISGEIDEITGPNISETE